MFSFIVLHYKNINDTIECLSNLKKIIGKNDKIVVVDNNTLTEKESSIIKKYTKNLILLDKNYGFAKANNIGIKYAKEKFNSEFYIVINNDVFITQKDFMNVIISDYRKYEFDMLGPYIDSPTGESVNPFPIIKDISKEIKKCKMLIKIYSSRILFFMLKIYIDIKHIFRKPIKPHNGEKLEKNVSLHGCAIIFSKKYIEHYDYPFYNETFLFHEEEFLYYRMKNDNLISIYDPKLIVFHKEGSSVNSINKTRRNSLLFREKERSKSLEILYNYVDRSEVENEK